MGVISAKCFCLDREITMGNNNIHSDAVICCELSTASGRGDPLTLTLYLGKKAAKEQFTMHFTCRLHNPEVAHSCGGALPGP